MGTEKFLARLNSKDQRLINLKYKLCETERPKFQNTTNRKEVSFPEEARVKFRTNK